MLNILFQSEGRLKVDWTQLHLVEGSVVLVCSASAASKHRDVDRAGHEVVIVDELTPESVRSFVASALQAMHPKDMRLATLDEHLIPTLGSIRDQFGIPGVSQEQSLRFSDKKLMKEALANSGVRAPQFVVVSADSEPPTYDLLVARLGSPLFVKPTCGAGSHGTRLIETEAEWRAWLTVRPEDVEFEVDAFLQGTLYHVDFVVGIDSSDWCSVGEYTHPNAEFLQGGTLGSRALSPDDWATPIVRHAAVQALNALGAGTGVYHVELFLSSAGTVTFLEAAMRPPRGHGARSLFAHLWQEHPVVGCHGAMEVRRSDRNYQVDCFPETNWVWNLGMDTAFSRGRRSTTGTRAAARLGAVDHVEMLSRRRPY